MAICYKLSVGLEAVSKIKENIKTWVNMYQIYVFLFKESKIWKYLK